MADASKAPTASEIAGWLEVAIETVEAAGPIALRYFRNPLDVEDKSTGGQHFDPVTRADREVEASIREALTRRFPDHGILGEEQPELTSDSPFRWVVDPIDGTRAFISGVPAWGILLGLTFDDACIAGVMHQPYLGETFFGSSQGAGLRRAGHDRVLRTRASADLTSAILYSTSPAMFTTENERASFESVAKQVQMLRYGGDCYSYALLAHGLIDLVIEGCLAPYDIIAMIPIIVGAGGVVTNWQGEDARHGGLIVAAANPKLHAQALEHLNQ